MPATLKTEEIVRLSEVSPPEIGAYPAKIYIEPTSLCNLACRTCMRNAWDELGGRMDAETFAQVMAGVSACPVPPTVFFGGFGEPLFHPKIIEMVWAAKATGSHAELITNGTLLTESRARGLIAAGLDGATPESYTDVRLGAALPDVITNVARLHDLRGASGLEIGVVFVAMRRNLSDLPDVLRLARDLGAGQFMITNVLPYTPEMCGEVLYAQALCNSTDRPVPDAPGLHLPRIDPGYLAADSAFYESVCETWGVDLAGCAPRPVADRCPFIVDGAVAVGWDGGVSPCLALLHTVSGYLQGYERVSRRYVIGNVRERNLIDLWRDPAHTALRERVRTFDFAPCTLCDGCSLSEANEEDCYGNGFPTCGGCLWAQGVVQCP